MTKHEMTTAEYLEMQRLFFSVSYGDWCKILGIIEDDYSGGKYRVFTANPSKGLCGMDTERAEILIVWALAKQRSAK